MSSTHPPVFDLGWDPIDFAPPGVDIRHYRIEVAWHRQHRNREQRPGRLSGRLVGQHGADREHWLLGLVATYPGTIN